MDWQQRDTAVYVVSTVNLLHTDSGRPFVLLVQRRLDVSRFDVYADADQHDLYFIRLKQDNGAVAGVLAYMMGWPTPKGVTSNWGSYGIDAAPDRIVQDYKVDRLQFYGSFTSTLPH